MEFEWAQVLLGAIGGGGIVGLVTQWWIFRTQLREERNERARARLQQLTLNREFLEFLGAMNRMTVLLGPEASIDEFKKGMKAYKLAMDKPMNHAVMFFLPYTIQIRLSRAWDLLEAANREAARSELARISEDLKEKLGIAILE